MGRAARAVARQVTDDIKPHLGWHSRGYVPHLDEPGRVQFITFRLADSLPRAVLEAWKEELRGTEPSRLHLVRARGLAEALDRGLGACWLQRSEIASVVEQCLLHLDGKRYRLLTWCVMPNHVHVLIDVFEGYPLDQVVHSWKSFTSQRCNQLLGRSGAFWARDYFDRFIRNEDYFAHAAAYIENNPAMARLVASPKDWRWSSAWHSAVPGSAASDGGLASDAPIFEVLE